MPARCVVADAEGELILEPGSFDADRRTRLVSVALDDPENVEVIEASVADYRGPDDLQGVLLEYPPRSVSFLEGLADWETPAADRRARGPSHATAGRSCWSPSGWRIPSEPGHVRGVTIKARTSAGPRTLGWEQLVLVRSLVGQIVHVGGGRRDRPEWTG